MFHNPNLPFNQASLTKMYLYLNLQIGAELIKESHQEYQTLRLELKSCKAFLHFLEL